MIIFKSAYQDHSERLFNYLLRMTGDYDLSRDIMQESFARCLEHYGTCIENVSLLYRIARNLVVDHMRKAARNQTLDDCGSADPRSLEYHANVLEHYREVLQALQLLTFEDRELLALVAVKSLSYREIAKILKISAANVKVRVHRARKRLRSLLEKQETRNERTPDQPVYRRPTESG